MYEIVKMMEICRKGSRKGVGHDSSIVLYAEYTRERRVARMAHGPGCVRTCFQKDSFCPMGMSPCCGHKGTSQSGEHKTSVHFVLV